MECFRRWRVCLVAKRDQQPFRRPAAVSLPETTADVAAVAKAKARGSSSTADVEGSVEANAEVQAEKLKGKPGWTPPRYRPRYRLKSGPRPRTQVQGRCR